jgi:hypothetical protein
MSRLVALACIAVGAFSVPTMAFASEPLAKAADPRVLLEFPTVLVGFEAPCTPQFLRRRGVAPNLPRTFMTSTSVGEVSPETFDLQVVADILRVQAACAGVGVVFGPGESLRLADGQEGRVFHSRPADGVRPVSIVYSSNAGSLYRYSLWLASPEDLQQEYPRFIANLQSGK